jgi:uncharacterized protein (TIGR03437 family)
MGPTCRQLRFIFRLLTSCLIAQCGAGLAVCDLNSASAAPVYTAAGIVQAASQTAGTLAPNSIATVYGSNLSWTTHAVVTADLNGKYLPNTLDGVTVYVNGYACALFFVSPGQVNFIIPYQIVDTKISVVLVRNGLSGPKVTVPFAAGAPAFFQWSGNFAVAEHADGSLISSASPAQAGEVVVLFATGLGRTSPDLLPDAVASTAMSILHLSDLQVLIDGVLCPPSSIYYAGVTPGFAGLYQINLKLPDALNSDPTIQLVMGAQTSPPTVQLFAN